MRTGYTSMNLLEKRRKSVSKSRNVTTKCYDFFMGQSPRLRRSHHHTLPFDLICLSITFFAGHDRFHSRADYLFLAPKVILGSPIAAPDIPMGLQYPKLIRLECGAREQLLFQPGHCYILLDGIAAVFPAAQSYSGKSRPGARDQRNLARWARARKVGRNTL